MLTIRLKVAGTYIQGAKEHTKEHTQYKLKQTAACNLELFNTQCSFETQSTVLVDFVEAWYVLLLIAEVTYVSNNHFLLVSAGPA